MARPFAHQSTQDISAEDRLRMIRVWTAIGFIVIFVCVVWALGYIAPAIEFLAVGIIVGFICSPIVNWLETKGVGRALGAILALLIVLGVAIGVLAILGPLTLEQLNTLFQRIPGYFRELQEWLRSLFERYGTTETAEFQTNISALVDGFSTMGTRFANDMASQISSGLIPNLMNLVNTFFMFFLGLVLAYWLARDYPRIVREFAVVAGPTHEDDLMLLLAVASRSMGGYMRGIVITSLVGGSLAFLGYIVVGQPYAPLMGTLTGLLHFVPVIGPWIAAAIATVTALFVSPLCAFWTLIVAMVAENITDNVVSPVVMRSAVQVHPAMSLLAIVLGSSLGGAVGMAISIPVSAAIKGVFIYYFETRTGRQIVSYHGAIFQGTPFHHADGSIAPSCDALDDDSFFTTSRLIPDENEGDVSAAPGGEPAKSSVGEIVRERAEELRLFVEHPKAHSGSSSDSQAPEARSSRQEETSDEPQDPQEEAQGSQDSPAEKPAHPGSKDKGER
ncbi:AI-2E family transporter [Olsenella sp. KGMB02461]|nr:AI-2E family transporter [Olsenella sp. KGMB02461]